MHKMYSNTKKATTQNSKSANYSDGHKTYTTEMGKLFVTHTKWEKKKGKNKNMAQKHYNRLKRAQDLLSVSGCLARSTLLVLFVSED